MKKGNMVEYTCSARRQVRAIVRHVHRDGSATVEARHVLNNAGEIEGCYLGFLFRIPASDLVRATGKEG